MVAQASVSATMSVNNQKFGAASTIPSNSPRSSVAWRSETRFSLPTPADGQAMKMLQLAEDGRFEDLRFQAGPIPVPGAGRACGHSVGFGAESS
jgi:hypothetical protein